MDILQMVIILILFALLIIPMGKHLYKVITGEKSFMDTVMDKVDNFLYKITGITKEEMSWKQYAISLVVTNLVMVILAYIILRIQGVNILNPNGAKGLESSLNFNTIISFVTNTNLQHYAGETGLSYLSQIIVITFFMFTSAASGFGAVAAFMRGITGRSKTVGNYFVDIVRIITRVLLPLSIVITIVLMAQGVPQTFSSNKTVTTIEGTKQVITLGPVASLESIKHLGTNGGGFFGANSSHPFENPTPFTSTLR